MPSTKLPFRISTGLKNIIGRDLITDDIIAVFELVKNSFDAHATKVLISFRDQKIIIEDDGKGMDLDDIKNKWLFVAYSAKKEGVEDKDLENKEFDSYRDKIQAKKFYAGAKGIGRFSCDRLGSELRLISKKASRGSKVEQIKVDWNQFDVDSEQDFLDIKVEHETLDPNSRQLRELHHGTILEITKLNSEWSREKKQELKYSLEKLINPFADVEDLEFRIILKDDSELDTDQKEKITRDKVNGEIKNFIIETLQLKTTEILSEIGEDGETIVTTLKDRGTLVYKLRRPNTTNPKLSNIKFHLFFLNRAAKLNFNKIMGIAAVNFGSIFLYKNGFRIAPYGDVGVDYFGIDSRHAQNIFRTLGLRDLIGRIEIIDTNSRFKEISSRDGGLVKNEYYNALMTCFERYTLTKLENYVTQVQWKSEGDKDLEDVSGLNNITSKSKLLALLATEVSADKVDIIDIDNKYVNLRSKELVERANEEEIENLKIIASKFEDETYSKTVKQTLKQFEVVKREKLQLEKQLKDEEEKRLKAEAELEAERKENLFNKKLAGTDIKEIIALQHHIDRATDKINLSIDQLITGINDDSPKSTLLRFVEKISLENKKISSVAQFATNANFNLKSTTITKDLNRFITEYIENVHQEYEHLKLNRQLLKVTVESASKPFIITFRPLEIIIILDNLFSNSYKAKSKAVTVILKNRAEKGFEITFEDDGRGIPDTVLSRVFNLGFTTTEGSGIGLFHVKQLVEKMKGDIIVNTNRNQGVAFKITLPGNEA